MESKELTIRQAILAGAKVSFVWLALCLIFVLSQLNSIHYSEYLFMAIVLVVFVIPGGILGALAGYSIRKPKSLTVILIWAVAGAVIGMICSFLVAVMVLPQ